MKDILLEIGVEEIPSAYMSAAINDLQQLARQKMQEARLAYEDIHVYGTPRRFCLFVEGADEYQADVLIDNRGPKKNIAFTADGQPGKAGLGFARAQGLEFNQLEVRDVDGIEYVFAVKREHGQPVEAILPALLLQIITGLSFPKSMRWGYYNTRFARPIRWLLALHGHELIEIQIENIVSASRTYGHRFLSAGELAVADIPSYFKVLQDNYVILDQDQRRRMIWQQVEQAAAAAGGVPMANDDLLEEVNYLVEYPTAFFGSFSPSYLMVPPEVLTTSMIEHQRYFPVFDGNGQLIPGFIGVRNGIDYNLDEVRAGNQRVLKARLEDALFFWNEDTRKSLQDMVPGLTKVMFHERLGSVMDKVERLQKLTVYIGGRNQFGDESRLSRAAFLCKADLLSNMVYEFPELQGIMGRYYALKSGEDSEVSEAILEHYLPRFAGDRLPQTGIGTALSLAEKLDNLVGCFCIGIKPSGSQDPYALRRQALGIVNILLAAGREFDLGQAIGMAYDGFAGINPSSSREDTIAEVLEFIMQRLRGVLLDRGFSYDVIEAVFALQLTDINDLLTRIDGLQEFKQSPAFDDFMVVFNRSYNLSKKWDADVVNTEVLQDDSEKELYRSLTEVKKDVIRLAEGHEYVAALTALAFLRPPLDQFFAAVMVMVEDLELRSARLSMLKLIANTSKLIADFGKIIY